jgi:carbamate kinase
VLGAETEARIGYLIGQELMNALPEGAHCATLLSRVEVARADPVFNAPSKPIGPVHLPEEAAPVQKE